jgi:hypothetical protein
METVMMSEKPPPSLHFDSQDFSPRIRRTAKEGAPEPEKVNQAGKKQKVKVPVSQKLSTANLIDLLGDEDSDQDKAER